MILIGSVGCQSKQEHSERIIISGGTLDNTDGDLNKTSVKKYKSVKSETQSIDSGVGG